MKHLFLIILCAFTISAYGETTIPRYELSKLDIIDYPMYEIDTIYDLAGYVYIADDDFYTYAVREEVFNKLQNENTVITYERLLSDPNVVILNLEFDGDSSAFYDWDYIFQHIVENNIDFRCVKCSHIEKLGGSFKNFKKIVFDTPPAGFLFALYRGDVINTTQYYNDFDYHKRPLNFPDKNAYYRVISPFWRLK